MSLKQFKERKSLAKWRPDVHKHKLFPNQITDFLDVSMLSMYGNSAFNMINSEFIF